MCSGCLGYRSLFSFAPRLLENVFCILFDIIIQSSFENYLQLVKGLRLSKVSSMKLKFHACKKQIRRLVVAFFLYFKFFFLARKEHVEIG